jgi:hypothetical protein
MGCNCIYNNTTFCTGIEENTGILALIQENIGSGEKKGKNRTFKSMDFLAGQ